MTNSTRRLNNDLLDLFRNPDPQIQVHLNKEALNSITTMMSGPIGTPYENGLFMFDLKFPSNYPAEPPKAKFLTTHYGETRFNPNLYANGKVCLSILGTFAGNPWSAAQNLQSVLVSILSLMSEEPYGNEPGFEVNEKSRQEATAYNQKIIHETIRISIVVALEKLLDMKEEERDSNPFWRHMLTHFLERYTSFIKRCDDHLHLDGSQFKTMRFEGSGNIMYGQFYFGELKQRLIEVHARVHELIWPVSIMQNQSFSKQACNPECHFVLDFSEVEPYHYKASILGPEDSPYEGFIIPVDIKTHFNNEAFPPLITVQCSLIHPCVSSDGVPYFGRDTPFIFVDRYLSLLYDMLKKINVSHPFMILNQEVSNLDKKQLSRLVRRSMEES